MRHLLSALAATALLTLAACGEDPAEAPPPPPAGEAIEDAARATGDAASSAVQDLRDAAGPAMERAREEGGRALDAAREGLNDLTRGAACQTARAADDAQGIAANC